MFYKSIKNKRYSKGGLWQRLQLIPFDKYDNDNWIDCHDHISADANEVYIKKLLRLLRSIS